MINIELPHCLLFVEQIDDAEGEHPWPQWSFRLQFPGEAEIVAASDFEPGVSGERLLLFGLMRGLEAIERPSRVSLICSSRYLRKGLETGIETWRSAGWKWEKFGRLVDVRDADLWQRVAQAAKFHQIAVKLWRVETAHEMPSRPHYLRRRIQLRNAEDRQRVPA